MPGPQDLIGKTAPSFTLTNHDGEPYEYKAGASGLPTALLFYPESGSYPCTKQVCQFRDATIGKTNFKKDKAVIIAISPNPVEKQKAFVQDQNLPFPVLSDVGKEVSGKTYGIGKGLLGMVPIARTTFVIDKKGVVRDVLDTTLNYSAHQVFVDKWLQKFEAEDKA